MDLREELARQSLLLEFIADCVSLGTVSDLAKLVGSRLHWLCDLDACSVLLPDAGGVRLWSHDRRVGRSESIADEALLASHRALLDAALSKGSPTLASESDTGWFIVAIPLGVKAKALGALCLSRASRGFSQSDLRHLQHAGSALGGALTRIAALVAEHEAERAVKSAEAQLRLAAEDRALLAEQMVGIVSHDLRNPLAAILAGTTLLGRGDAPAPQKERVLQNVQRATRRARRLVEDLLDFTQARVGQGLSLRISDVSLDELMASALQELTLSFPAMNVVYAGEHLGSARLDADRVQQILGNLVSNAVTHGAAGGPIHLRCEASNDQFVISVTNEGAPVPPALLATMFEPLVRGTDHEGHARSVGLGLYIVKAIARAHGGHVEVESVEGEGTTFTVRLPVNASAA